MKVSELFAFARFPPSSTPPFLSFAADSTQFWKALQLRRARDRTAQSWSVTGDERQAGAAPDLFVTLPGAHHAFNFVTSSRSLAMGDAIMDWLNCVHATAMRRRGIIVGAASEAAPRL